MLANLLYSSPCALSIVDARAEDQPVLYVNAVFELETGYSYSEAVGQNCRFLQAPPGATRGPSFASVAIKRCAPSPVYGRTAQARSDTARTAHMALMAVPHVQV